MSASNYTDGYVSGQHDALTWLSLPPMPGDHPLAPIDLHVQPRAALVCLAANLAQAAALCRAFELGGRHGYDHAVWHNVRNPWEPGCGKATL